MSKLVPKFSKYFVRVNWESPHWSLRRYLNCLRIALLRVLMIGVSSIIQAYYDFWLIDLFKFFSLALFSDMVKHELRVTSCELRAESLKAWVEIQKYEFKSTSYVFESTSYEFKFTSYEFESTSLEFESTGYEFESTSCEFESTSRKFESTRTISSMKTQVNSLKSSVFSKIVSPKLFGNSWGNLYVQFLVIQWNLYKADTIRSKKSVRFMDMSAL